MSEPSNGVPPVLKVKKDAEQEIRYHYRRDDRMALKRPRPEERRSGFFARLRRGRFRSLLPVLAGLLAVALLARLLSRDRSAGRLAGYDLSLRAYAYEDALLASVTVTPSAGAAGPTAGAAEATVRFSTTTAGPASVAIEPLGTEEVVVRGRLPYTGAERQVTADVAIGGQAVRLSAPVGEP